MTALEVGGARPSVRATNNPLEKTHTFAFVDDHCSMTEMCAFAIEAKSKLKCVGTFARVDAAVVALRALPVKPDVVIVDWRMDGKEHGGEVVRTLKSDLPDTSWLLFTAWASLPDVLRRALAAGVNGSVSKSASYEELLRAMVTLIDRQPYFCSASLKALTAITAGRDVALTLSATDHDILRLLAEGNQQKEIAAELGLAYKTVLNALVSIRQKVKKQSMVELAKFAVDTGIAHPE